MRRHVWVLGLVVATACGDDEQQAARADQDADGWQAPIDCDDKNPDVHPGADEIPYDMVDQDCSGSDLTDVDGDGFHGGRTREELAAGGAGGAGGAESGGATDDCDDTRADVNPAAIDICGDAVDQDCSGRDQACDVLDQDGDGVTGLDGDCNDGDADVGPESDEVYYNGVDDDCDPATDDGDQDGDGFSRFAGGDCDDEDSSIFPGADETPYNGVDEDCSGSDLVDVDEDGVPGGDEGADCDDLDPEVRPDRDELVLDGVDQNCDGSDLAGVDAFKPFLLPNAVAAGVPEFAVGTNQEGEVAVLTAWSDSRVVSRQDIYALSLDANGDPMGSEIEVAIGGLEKFNVQVTSDGNDFLVTWETTEGVFGRLLSAEGPTAAETQLAPIGATGTRTSYGGGNYAMVWLQTDASPVELRVRMLSSDGVKDDNRLIAAYEAATAVAVAGRPGDLIAVWTGGGVHGRSFDGRGRVTGDIFDVADDPTAALPSIASSDAGYLAAFVRGLTPLSVAGVVLDASGTVGPMTRVSDHSWTISTLSVSPTPLGYAIGWTDGRHSTRSPSFMAIYGNYVDSAGVPANPSDAAWHVESNVQLGGLVFASNNLLVSSRNLRGIGALVVPEYQ